MMTVADQSGLESLGLLNTGIPGSSLTHAMDVIFYYDVVCSCIKHQIHTRVSQIKILQV